MDGVQIFIVRVWRSGGEFRASVRGVTNEEPRLFCQPGEIAEFLHRVAAGDSGPAMQDGVRRPE